MSTCDGPKYTCGQTKDAITSTKKTISYSHTVNRSFTLIYGGKEITINKRTRSYSYSDNKSTSSSNYIFVVVPDGFDVAYMPCYAQSTSGESHIKENYETFDTTFYYVDLRNDNIVYKESTQAMAFDRTEKQTVAIQTSYDDAHLFPYIMESVPITINNRFICTALTAPLLEETINSGYWNGIRILMPLFNGGVPRQNTIVIDGVSYNAGKVDWYYIPDHKEKDGDQNFWWADWHKAVGEHTEIDKTEAEMMWQSIIGQNTNLIQQSGNGVSIKDFMGSAAKDRVSNLFLSAALTKFDGGMQLVSKLVIDGTETEIPKDCECDVWYPISPI